MSLGIKDIRPGEAVNFAADWSDWLDTDRDGTEDDTISTSSWSDVNSDGGLTVGSTTDTDTVSTATFTCAATTPVGHVFTIKNTMTTTTSGETFIRTGQLRVVR